MTTYDIDEIKETEYTNNDETSEYLIGELIIHKYQ